MRNPSGRVWAELTKKGLSNTYSLNIFRKRNFAVVRQERKRKEKDHACDHRKIFRYALRRIGEDHPADAAVPTSIR